LAALDFRAGVEQPFGCVIIQNRQAREVDVNGDRELHVQHPTVLSTFMILIWNGMLLAQM